MKNFDIKDDTSRASAGYGTQLMVFNPEVEAFTLLLALEEVPTPVGSPETFEVNLLTSNSKGSVQGKRDTEDATTDIIWHRDNILRLNELKGKQHDMLIMYPDGTGWKFTASIEYAPNTAGSDVLKGTLTITPSSVGDSALINVRPLCKKTCFITTVINSDEEILASGTFTKDLTGTSPNAVWTVESDNDDFAASIAGNKLTVTTTGVELGSSAVIILKCSLADKSMASSVTSFILTAI